MPKRKQDNDGLYKRKDSPFWWVSYADASGARTRRSTQVADRRQAGALLAKWKLDAYRARNWEEQPARSFDELMLCYLIETLHKKRTGPSRIRSAAKHLYRKFTGYDLNSIQAHEIRTYIRMRQGQGAAASTINKEVGLFSVSELKI